MVSFLVQVFLVSLGPLGRGSVSACRVAPAFSLERTRWLCNVRSTVCG